MSQPYFKAVLAGGAGCWIILLLAFGAGYIGLGVVGVPLFMLAAAWVIFMPAAVANRGKADMVAATLLAVMLGFFLPAAVLGLL